METESYDRQECTIGVFEAAYQLTSNQMEGKRRGSSYRNRNSKGNIRHADRERGEAVFVLELKVQMRKGKTKLSI